MKAIRLLILALVSLAPPVRGEEPEGQAADLWSLGTLELGRVYPTTLAAHNESCRGDREFVFSIEGADWLRITGPERVVAAKGETATTTVEVDLRGVAPGVYNDGKIVTRCPECPRKCLLDYREIEIRLTVESPEEPDSITDPATGRSGGARPDGGPTVEIQDDGDPPATVAAVADDAGSALAEAWKALKSFTEEHLDAELTLEEVGQAYARLWELTVALSQAQAEFLGWQAVARREELDEATRRCLEEGYARLAALDSHFAEALAKLHAQVAKTDQAYARFNELLGEAKKWRGIAPPAEAVRNAGLVSQAAYEAKKEDLKRKDLESEADFLGTISEIRRVEERIDACLKKTLKQLFGARGGLDEPGPGPAQLLTEPYSGNPLKDLEDSARARAWGLDRLIGDLWQDFGGDIQQRALEEKKKKLQDRQELEKDGGKPGGPGAR